MGRRPDIVARSVRHWPRPCLVRRARPSDRPLRPTEALLRSIAALLDIAIAMPDDITLSRRRGRVDHSTNVDLP
jgi:hypothetical protein